MRVLMVEDCKILRRLMLRNLKLIGITDVVEAEDGEDGWKKFNEMKFDLVLTDWNMPGSCGIKLLESIRDSGSKVPVVMVTAEDNKKKLRTAAHAGISEYLCKPFTQEEFWQKIDKFSVAEGHFV
ncbi:MAG: chemotaxis response regulator CheY [Aureliella sp.]